MDRWLQCGHCNRMKCSGASFDDAFRLGDRPDYETNIIIQFNKIVKGIKKITSDFFALSSALDSSIFIVSSTDVCSFFNSLSASVSSLQDKKYNT